MSGAKTVFHGCFKAFPGSSQFVCHDEIKAGTSWHVDLLHAVAESVQRQILFSPPSPHM